MKKIDLKKVQSWLKEQRIDALFVAGTDPHKTEYLPDAWNLRKYISGFDGSAGNIVVGQEKAALITDSRYTLQAKEEVDGRLFEVVISDARSPYWLSELEWIFENIKEKPTIAVYEKQTFVELWEHLNDLDSQGEINLVVLTENPSLIFWDQRPDLPTTKITQRPEYLDELSAKEKLDIVRREMKSQGADAHFASNLESVARTLNIRAFDVHCNLLCFSYLLVLEDRAILYAQLDGISVDLIDALEGVVEFADYDQIADVLVDELKGKKLLVAKSELTVWLWKTLEDVEIIYGRSPITDIKKNKFKKEVDFMYEAHKSDGVALTNAFYSLFETLKTSTISEYDFGLKLKEERSKIEGFLGNSFDPIVGYQGNGAIVHYRAPEVNSATIKANGCLLVDSGAHYETGTTDITRTFSLDKEPSKQLMEDYTLVLKGHLAVTRLQFMKHTTCAQVDLMARAPLWSKGKNYGHGTGHGVGYGTCVHETADVGISAAYAGKTYTEGNIISNEPGFYLTGQYGIRIENLLAVEKRDNEFLGFRDLTLFPYDVRLIEKSLLNEEELKQINDYHKHVYAELSERLEADKKAWLKSLCEEI